MALGAAAATMIAAARVGILIDSLYLIVWMTRNLKGGACLQQRVNFLEVVGGEVPARGGRLSLTVEPMSSAITRRDTRLRQQP